MSHVAVLADEGQPSRLGEGSQQLESPPVGLARLNDRIPERLHGVAEGVQGLGVQPPELWRHRHRVGEVLLLLLWNVGEEPPPGPRERFLECPLQRPDVLKEDARHTWGAMPKELVVAHHDEPPLPVRMPGNLPPEPRPAVVSAEVPVLCCQHGVPPQGFEHLNDRLGRGKDHHLCAVGQDSQEPMLRTPVEHTVLGEAPE